MDGEKERTEQEKYDRRDADKSEEEGEIESVPHSFVILLNFPTPDLRIHWSLRDADVSIVWGQYMQFDSQT